MAEVDYRAYVCTVGFRGEILFDGPLTRATDLWVTVTLQALDEIVGVDLRPSFQDFIASGRANADYEVWACKTIVKFGAAMQFKEPVSVRFGRISGLTA